MKSWQAKLGFWGTLAWLGSFELGSLFQAADNKDLALTVYGYTMGYLTVFAGHLFWSRVVQRRWSELLGEGWFSISFSALCLIAIFVMGLLGVYNSIFNASPWFYTLLFVIGGVVVNQGLMPTIDHFDGRGTSVSQS